MEKHRKESSNYKEALRQLIHLIDTEYRNGGKLLSASVMAQRFGVSLVTYHKAQKIICRENLAKAEASKNGTYIFPYSDRRKKLGIALEDGKPSPFMSMPSVFAGFLNELERRDILTHLIQGRSPEDIFEESELLDLDGLVWIAAPPASLQPLRRLARTCRFPFAVCSNRTEYLESDLTVYGFDPEYHVKIKVSALHENNSRRFLCPYIGTYEDDLFRKYLSEYGIPYSEDAFLNIAKGPGGIMRRIEKTGADTLLCDQGEKKMEPIFQLLSALPPEKQPAIVTALPAPRALRKYSEQYPYIRITGSFHPNPEVMGTAFAAETARHIMDGTPFSSIRCKATEYHPFQLEG